MKKLYQLPPKEDIYSEFEYTIKEAAITLYGITLETISREVDLVRVDPGEDLNALVTAIGCAKLAHIASKNDGKALKLNDVTMDLNLTALIARAFLSLVNGDFADYHVPGNHVPEGYLDGSPVIQNEAENIPLNTATSE